MTRTKHIKPKETSERMAYPPLPTGFDEAIMRDADSIPTRPTGGRIFFRAVHIFSILQSGKVRQVFEDAPSSFHWKVRACAGRCYETIKH